MICEERKQKEILIPHCCHCTRLNWCSLRSPSSVSPLLPGCLPAAATRAQALWAPKAQYFRGRRCMGLLPAFFVRLRMQPSPTLASEVHCSSATKKYHNKMLTTERFAERSTQTEHSYLQSTRSGTPLYSVPSPNTFQLLKHQKLCKFHSISSPDPATAPAITPNNRSITHHGI